jgi:hypothetical protein
MVLPRSSAPADLGSVFGLIDSCHFQEMTAAINQWRERRFAVATICF